MKRRVLRVLAVLTGCILAFGCGMAVYAQESIPEEEAVNIEPFAAEPESFCDEPAALSDEPVLPAVSYQTHVQSYGWQEPVSEGTVAGTTGLSKRLEAVKIALNDSDYEGSIQYQVHVQSYGWMDWRSDNAVAGTTGESKRLEAIRIRLSGEIADAYEVYYRVHAQSFGWLDWAKDGETAGTTGLSKRLEAIEIRLVKKGDPAPGAVSNPCVILPSVTCQVHMQSYGWMEQVTGKAAGVTGESKRMEALKLLLSDSGLDGAIQYRAHVQSYGWMDWASDGDMAGTTGEAKRMEAVQIRLTDGLSNAFDVYYRVHVQNYGWLGWAKNGEKAGTEGRSLRMEAMEIQVVPKGTEGFSSGTPAFIEKETVSSGNQNGINDPNGIYGNGTGGIYIDIHSAPYTTFASYAYGQYAYSSEGCAWFAASRVHELTGVGTTIWSGRNWWNGGQGRYGFSTGTALRGRALACYTNHVAVVEKVVGNKVYVSEGGYSGSGMAAHGCTIIRETTEYGVTHGRNGVGTFLGYVYLP